MTIRIALALALAISATAADASRACRIRHVRPGRRHAGFDSAQDDRAGAQDPDRDRAQRRRAIST